MTGFGEASLDCQGWQVRVEIRTVNNRHLKINLRADESLLGLEAEIERLARGSLLRGTVQVSIDSVRPSRPDAYQINRVALDSYLGQVIEAMGGRVPDQSIGALMAGILALPGVVPEHSKRATGGSHEEDWLVLKPVISEALSRLGEMRLREGANMSVELLAMSKQVRGLVEKVRQRVPSSLAHHQERLRDRVNQVLSLHEPLVQVDTSQLAREIALLADRVDISEEMVRLDSHLDQFDAMVGPQSREEGVGRKLEFLIQEMGREANTMGSKSPDIDISRSVVEIKSTMERIRELVLNVE
jgi:uncharacterized protein (TIGR00255 family)